MALVNIEGKIYELDGRKQLPVCHGATSETTFLNDAAAVCRGFIDRHPNDSRFAIMSLGPTQ